MSFIPSACATASAQIVFPVPGGTPTLEYEFVIPNLRQRLLQRAPGLGGQNDIR
jgi:hypothetical protein